MAWEGTQAQLGHQAAWPPAPSRRSPSEGPQCNLPGATVSHSPQMRGMSEETQEQICEPRLPHLSNGDDNIYLPGRHRPEDQLTRTKALEQTAALSSALKSLNSRPLSPGLGNVSFLRNPRSESKASSSAPKPTYGSLTHQPTLQRATSMQSHTQEHGEEALSVALRSPSRLRGAEPGTTSPEMQTHST